MTTEESSKMRNPLMFILGVVIAAGITGGAVWYATRHQAAIPAPVETAAVETPAPTATTDTTKDVPAGSAFTDAQKAELSDFIKDYIIKNPDVLMQSLEAKAKEIGESQKNEQGRLSDVPKGLYDYPMTPFVGPEDAKLVVVEFFDYNCGFCKRVVNDYNKVIAEEPDVKFMFKELPILSAESEIAARYALAANKQDKYIPFHTAIMEHQGPVSQSLLEEKAKELGLDVAQLKKDAASQDVSDALQKNMELARELGVQGTPYFVVGKERVPGAVGYTRLKDIISQERAALDPKPPLIPAPVPAKPAAQPIRKASPTEPQQDEPITE